MSRENKTKQISIKDMLLAKAAAASAEVPVESSITLPAYLMCWNDVRCSVPVPGESVEPTYKCSQIARIYFRDHSNVVGVVYDYLNDIDTAGKSRMISTYTSGIIRTVTSCAALKHLPPFNKFEFENKETEAIARDLLIYPDIDSDEKFEDYEEFRIKYGLKFLNISMDKRNLVHDNAKAYIQLKRNEDKSERSRIHNSRLKFSILRSYYEQNDLLKIINIRDIKDVNELESISNYRKVITKMVLEDGEYNEEAYNDYADATLDCIKKDPSSYSSLCHFNVNPMYDIVSNIMTAAQEEHAASSYKEFYRLTNANLIRKTHQIHIDKKKFYFDYKKRSGEMRKMAPYNNLNIIDLMEHLDDPDDVSLLDAVRVGHLQHRELTVLSKNPELTPVKTRQAPKETCTETVDLSSDEDEDETELQIPERFLQVILLSDEILPLMKMLSNQVIFVKHVKMELGEKYKKNFEWTWKTYKPSILKIFVKENWEESPRDLIPIARKLTEPTRDEVLKILEARAKQLEQLEENLGENSLSVEMIENDVSDIIVTLEKQMEDNAPAEHQIKRELLSQVPIFDNSDVVCLGSLNEIIDLDSEENDSLVNETEYPRDLIWDRILEHNQFGIPSPAEPSPSNQPDELQLVESPRLVHSEETLNRLRQFEAKSVHQLRQDRIEERKRKASEMRSTLKESTNQQMTPTKKNATKQQEVYRPGPKSRKVKNRLYDKNISYVDEDESPTLDGNSSYDQLQQALNDHFSIFLSSQITRAERAFDRNPFTFASKLSSQQVIDAQPTTSCFIVNHRRVIFIKNVKFELHVNLPQFTLYDIVMTDSSIPPLLGINTDEYRSLLQLLNLVEKYEFVFDERSYGKRAATNNAFIFRQLDLFFSSQIKFRSFNLHVNADEFNCVDGSHTTKLTADLTSAIDPEILSAMKSLKI